MSASYENSLDPSADTNFPDAELARRNFETNINRLGEIIGHPPVLTLEIQQRLGQDAYTWASRGVDLSITTPAGEYSDRPESAGSSPQDNGAALRRLAQRNLAALYRDCVGESPFAPPPGIREDLERTALYLAEQGVDLLDASDIPDINDEDVTD